MRVLLTGGSGFVGSHAAAALAVAGHDLRLLAREPAGLAHVPSLAALPSVEVREGDITDAAAVRHAVQGCDAVVHTAGAVTTRRRDGDDLQAVNVDGTVNVIEAALAARVGSIVHVSSTAVFGHVADVLTPHLPLAEGRGAYARSKLAAERWVRARQRSGAPITVVYPAGVIGPDAPRPTALHDALRQWLEVPPDTSSGIALVDVRDVGAVLARAVSHEPGGRFVAGGHWHSWAGLRGLLGELTGRTIATVPTPGAVLRAAGRIVETLATALGTEPPVTAQAMDAMTRGAPCDSSATEAALGVTFRPATETLADTITWMYRVGLLDGRLAGTLAR